MKVVFTVLIILAILLIIPLKFNLHFNYNMLKNKGVINLKFYFISIIYYNIKVNGFNIVLKNKKETKKLDVEINKENVEFANELQKQLYKRFYLQDLDLYITIGSSKNASLVALFSGFLDTILSVLFGYIKVSKITSQLNLKIYPLYDQDNAAITLNIKASISLTNILLSFIKTKKIINNRKEQKYGKRVQASN